MTHVGVEFENGQVELVESSAAEILGSLARARRARVLTFTRPGASCRLWTRNGVIYAASASDPANRLGERLRELGALDAAVLQSTLLASKTSGRALGTMLVEERHLPPVEVREALRVQVNEAVRDVLSWCEGRVDLEVTAAEDADEGEIHVSVPIRRAVLRGLRLAQEIEPLIERLGGADQVLEPCYEMDEVIDAAFGEREFELLRLVDGTRSVEVLGSEGPFREEKNLRIVVALWALQLVRPAGGRMIRFPDVASSDARGRPEADDAELEDLLREAMEHYLLRDYRASLSTLDRCLELSPNNRRALHNRERVQRRIDDR